MPLSVFISVFVCVRQRPEHYAGNSSVLPIYEDGDAMAYCGICGRYHDPGESCIDATNQVLKDIGLSDAPKSPGADFGRIAKRSDRWFLKVLILIFAALALAMYLTRLANKLG